MMPTLYFVSLIKFAGFSKAMYIAAQTQDLKKKKQVNINSDINILGGLPDWNLINVYFKDSFETLNSIGQGHTYTSIKTDKSVKRFEKAISSTLLRYANPDVKSLVNSILSNEGISNDSLIALFWNASFNNELLHYLNKQVYFHAFYSGRLLFKKEEASACIKHLKESEPQLKDWSINTINTVSRKYLTLLRRFNLMEGTFNKKIAHPYLSDKMFVQFIYWIKAIETKGNLLDSEWLKYSFYETPLFIERVLQKKFGQFFHLQYTGDKLSIETLLPYSNIYYAIK